MKNLSILFVAVLFSISTAFGQKTWNIDQSHSNIGFTVTHMVISEVEGTFDEFEGSVVESDNGLEGASINFKANIASIDTDNEKRDGHLKSADFFSLTFLYAGLIVVLQAGMLGLTFWDLIQPGSTYCALDRSKQAFFRLCN